jgi:hypothetical protein
LLIEKLNPVIRGWGYYYPGFCNRTLRKSKNLIKSMLNIGCFFKNCQGYL